MGWNRLQPMAESPLLQGLGASSQAYFVHSFAAPLSGDTLASCTHGEPFAAVVGRGNRFGAQFHPERSAGTGARLLENFLAGAAA
jgi:glutamine amidotransferase